MNIDQEGQSATALTSFRIRVGELCGRSRAGKGWVGTEELREWNRANPTPCGRCLMSKDPTVCDIADDHPSCLTCRTKKVSCDRRAQFLFEHTKDKFFADFDEFQSALAATPPKAVKLINRVNTRHRRVALQALGGSRGRASPYSTTSILLLPEDICFVVILLLGILDGAFFTIFKPQFHSVTAVVVHLVPERFRAERNDQETNETSCRAGRDSASEHETAGRRSPRASSPPGVCSNADTLVEVRAGGKACVHRRLYDRRPTHDGPENVASYMRDLLGGPAERRAIRGDGIPDHDKGAKRYFASESGQHGAEPSQVGGELERGLPRVEHRHCQEMVEIVMREEGFGLVRAALGGPRSGPRRGGGNHGTDN
ncbi:hypothetical protein C8F04DRAFT_1197901 [Mycena alexandri]|uniref:Uncharacterized protein n=1 Tax=Mycena alexandri TaxID=1745969 RepID=A0AAD6WM23_9AGAR|nr:hypothetical protein C8F04DRAFT_1197901 [Mycena alexandri]